MGYIYTQNLQFAAYGQFVLVFKMNETELRRHYIHQEHLAVMAFEAMRLEVYSISKKSCPIFKKWTLSV